jgi:ABC-type multidrug transport system ATPase subunit
MKHINNNVILDIENLSISYRNFFKTGENKSLKEYIISFEDVIKNSSFQVSKGEVVLIQGNNGSGKSSILNAIIGNLPFSGKASGVIRFNNIVIDSSQPKSFNDKFFKIRKQIGNVDQEAFKHNDTILNILYDSYINSQTEDKKTSKVIFDKRLKDLFSFFRGNDFDYKAFCLKKFNSFSGGQKRLVEILAAFIRDTELYIIDEPINNLDFDTAKKVGAYIDLLKDQGKAVLLITHCRLFLQCTRAYKIEENNVIELLDVPKACDITDVQNKACH